MFFTTKIMKFVLIYLEKKICISTMTVEEFLKLKTDLNNYTG